MKRLLFLSLLAVSVSYGAERLSTTTTTGGVGSSSPVIQLASTSGAAAGYRLYIDREAMLVVSVDSGSVTVRRGYEGTAATDHAVGASAWVGPQRFFSYDDLTGAGCTNKAAVGEQLLSIRTGSLWRCTASGAWVAGSVATLPFTDDGSTVTFASGRNVAIGSTLIDPKRGAISRFGNKTIFIGDSISTVTASAPSTLQNGAWTVLAAIQSKWQVNWFDNAGVGGQTCAQIAARFSTDVLAKSPDKVVILCGTNDVGVTDDSTAVATIKGMVETATTAGIQPIVCTIPPKQSGHVNNMNRLIRQLTADKRIPLVDLYSVLVDTASTGYGSGLTTDNTHPTATAQLAMANKFVADAAAAFAPQIAPFAFSNVEPDNVLTDGLNLVDGNSNGIADHLSSSGTGSGTYSLVTGDTAIRGSWQKINKTSGNTAAKLIEDATNNSHYAFQFVTVTAQQYTFSAYVKPAGRNYTKLQSNAMNGSYGGVYFDVSGPGRVLTADTGFTGSITPADGGWYRVAITFTAASTGSKGFLLHVANGDGVVIYTGDNASGLYVDAVMVNAGALTTYSDSAPNLLSTPRDLNNAAWSKSNATTSANQAPEVIGTDTLSLGQTLSVGSVLHVGDTIALSARVKTSVASTGGRWSVIISSGGSTWQYGPFSVDVDGGIYREIVIPGGATTVSVTYTVSNGPGWLQIAQAQLVDLTNAGSYVP